MKSMYLYFGAFISSACALAATPARAEFPEHDITMVIGYAAGGSTDVMARAMTPFLEKYLGGKVAVVVKNVTGAGGQVAITQVAQATPDGYTIGNLNLPGSVARTYDRKASYSLDSFTYIANIVDDTSVLVAKADGPYKSLKDVIEAAKKDPGVITYAISGLGGDDHLGGVQLAKAAGVTFTYIPFGSAAPGRTAVMGGHVAVAGLNISEIQGYEDSIKVLGLMGDERSSFAPKIPTMHELGYDVEMSSSRGFVAPAGLPAEARKTLLAAMKKTYEDPAFQEIARKQGLALRLMLGDAYEAYVRKQSSLIGEVWRTDPWKK